MVPAADPVVELLAAILDELRALREACSSPAGFSRLNSTLSRTDRDRLSRLLPALAGVFGSEQFTTREALEHRAIGFVAGGLSSRQVGQLLSRALEQPVAGYVVRRGGREAHVVLWFVEQTV